MSEYAFPHNKPFHLTPALSLGSLGPPQANGNVGRTMRVSESHRG